MCAPKGSDARYSDKTQSMQDANQGRQAEGRNWVMECLEVEKLKYKSHAGGKLQRDTRRRRCNVKGPGCGMGVCGQMKK